MLTKTIRDYTAEELKIMEARKPSAYKQFEEHLLIFIGVFTVLLIPILVFEKYLSTTVQTICICAIALLTIFIIERIKNKYGAKNKAVKIPAQKMEVFHIKTNRAIMREDFEDLGDSYYIDVTFEGQRKTLYLWGQHFYELQEDKLFPNTEFEVTRKLGQPNTFDIKVFGEYFEPEKILPAFDKATWKSGNIPQDLDILDITIDEVKS